MIYLEVLAVAVVAMGVAALFADKYRAEKQKQDAARARSADRFKAEVQLADRAIAAGLHFTNGKPIDLPSREQAKILSVKLNYNKLTQSMRLHWIEPDGSINTLGGLVDFANYLGVRAILFHPAMLAVDDETTPISPPCHAADVPTA